MNESFPQAVFRLMGQAQATELADASGWGVRFIAAAAAAYRPQHGPFRLTAVKALKRDAFQSLRNDTEALLYEDPHLVVWCTPFLLVVHRPDTDPDLAFTMVGLVGRSIPSDHAELVNLVMKDVLHAP